VGGWVGGWVGGVKVAKKKFSQPPTNLFFSDCHILSFFIYIFSFPFLSFQIFLKINLYIIQLFSSSYLGFVVQSLTADPTLKQKLYS
jgi:hypothetical protein